MCSVINNNNSYVKNNTLSLNPTTNNQDEVPYPTTINIMQKGKYAEAANSLLSTINIDNKNIHDWAILDSGATSHFLVTKAPTKDRQIANSPLQVRLPDGARVASTHTCTLDIPQLPEHAKLGHIIPGLASHSLLSVVRLCNAGCDVIFTKIECIVKYRGRTVLRGKKCTRTGLWMVPISDDTKNVNMAIEENFCGMDTLHRASAAHEDTRHLPTTSKPELARYLHQILCSPPKTALLKAIRNKQLDSFPGLTYELIAKHLPPSTATEKGHMVRTRQGTRSTRDSRQAVLDARQYVDDMNPEEHVCTAEDDEMFCFAVLADQNEGTVYSDLAGRFPVRSYSGMNYIFALYVYSINAILVKPMKTRADDCMVAAFRDIYSYLETRNLKPRLHVLDNECSHAVKTYLQKENVDIQIVEPHNHRVNAAEPAVKAIKYHMIAGLATVDPDCPMQIWDKMLQQMQDALNMLRTSRRDKTKSAFHELEGNFDFDKTPMSVLGSKALA